MLEWGLKDITEWGTRTEQNPYFHVVVDDDEGAHNPINNDYLLIMHMNMMKSYEQETTTELGTLAMDLFLPHYHDTKKPTPKEITLAETSWKAIEICAVTAFSNNRYNDQHASSAFDTCLNYFATTFFLKLNSLDSSLEGHFSSHVIHRMSWCTKFFSRILSKASCDESFQTLSKKLARKYIEKGLDIHQIGLVGDALLHALSVVLENELTEKVKLAWIRIMSWLLREMLPYFISKMLKGDRKEEVERIPIYGDWTNINTFNRKKPKSPCKSRSKGLLGFFSGYKSSSLLPIEEEE